MTIQLETQIKPFILLILAVCLISLNVIFAKTNESIGSKREVMSLACYFWFIHVSSNIHPKIKKKQIFY